MASRLKVRYIAIIKQHYFGSIAWILKICGRQCYYNSTKDFGVRKEHKSSKSSHRVLVSNVVLIDHLVGVYNILNNLQAQDLMISLTLINNVPLHTFCKFILIQSGMIG